MCGASGVRQKFGAYVVPHGRSWQGAATTRICGYSEESQRRQGRPGGATYVPNFCYTPLAHGRGSARNAPRMIQEPVNVNEAIPALVPLDEHNAGVRGPVRTDRRAATAVEGESDKAGQGSVCGDGTDNPQREWSNDTR